MSAKHFIREFERVIADDPAALTRLGYHYQRVSHDSDGMLDTIASNTLKSWDAVKEQSLKLFGQRAQKELDHPPPLHKLFLYGPS